MVNLCYLTLMMNLCVHYRMLAPKNRYPMFSHVKIYKTFNGTNAMVYVADTLGRIRWDIDSMTPYIVR